MANAKVAGFVTKGLSRHGQSHSLLSLHRTFFASSTDHTTLLSNAKVHVLSSDDDNKKQYMLAADNMPIDIIKKEPKLGLACLYTKGNMMFGAKVINRSLGTPVDVCSKLVDAAQTDITSSGEKPLGRASLHGLCAWVEKGIEQEYSHAIPLLNELQTQDKVSFEAVQAIATGKPRPGHSVLGQGTFRDGQGAWEALAAEYVDQGLAQEAELYLSKGGKLVAIESLADTSKDYLASAGGAMARFSFS